MIDGEKENDSTMVGFGAYVYRGVGTKAGVQGEITNTTLQNTGAGFGVFGYSSETSPYNGSLNPDFMYNQPVKYQAGHWTYTPVKYWPNESSARLSFFAYAPFVEVTPSTGRVIGEETSGIVGMTHHLAAGDPMLQYRTQLVPGRDVDLCWGAPFLDMARPSTEDRLQFAFHHALSQLNVQIDTDADIQRAQETRIYVRSVTFTGFATQGSFNLNSPVGAPGWYDISGKGRLSRDPVTVFDGRADGSEGRAGALDVTEKLATLNPGIVQTAPYDISIIDGVTETTVNLFENSEVEAPVLVVPLTGTPLSVTIVYDVETADPELTGRLSDGVTRGISIENRITKEIMLSDGTPMTLSAGKKYKVNLHLGLTGVKLGGSVMDWDDVEYGKSDLPDNKVGFEIELSKRSSTVWRNETNPTLPDVTVKNKEHQEVTASLRWESDNTAVATVAADGSSVELGVAGVAHLKVTAVYEGLSKSAVYTLFVNEVTGISISPDVAWVEPAGEVSLAANMSHTEFGNITTWPEVTWMSDDTSIASLFEPGAVTDHDGVATSTVVAKGVSVGVTLVTASIDAGYMASGKSNRSGGEIHCVEMSHGKFRGYVVSPGVLYKKADGSYDLTNKDGNDPFEFERYYNVNSSIGVYYHQWSSLRDYFGRDAQGNIKADSSLLPSDDEGRKWVFPTSSMWETIMNGTPKAPITINGQTVSKGYAMVTINHAGKAYTGVLLLRDGLTYNCLSLTKVGQPAKYSDNVLSSEIVAELQSEGCLFIMSTGHTQKTPQGIDWWTSQNEGRYYTSSSRSGSVEEAYSLVIIEDIPISAYYVIGTSAMSTHYAVRLVRLATDN